MNARVAGFTLVAFGVALLAISGCSGAPSPNAEPNLVVRTTIPVPPTPAPLIQLYPVPGASGAGLGDITTGPDRNLWFSTSTGKIGRMTTAGAVQLFSLPPQTILFGIASGPDGNVWFIAYVLSSSSSEIGKITPLGTITLYPVSVTVSEGQLASGPDGNIWFTDYNGNVDKMTTSGVLTSYPIPSPVPEPYGMARGPDGRMWFTEANSSDPNGGGVGAVTTGGSVTPYVPPFSYYYSAPYGITAGPDGNLWFCDQRGAILKVTTGGVFTAYTTPTVEAFPFEIVTGPDGNLWFTENYANQIGRITTKGQITEFPIPSPTYFMPSGITAGSDGNVWFTEGNMIGKVRLH